MLLLRLGVHDAFHVGDFARWSDKAFTWSNVHKGNTTIQIHIDRIYILTKVEHTGGTIEILSTLPDIVDHAGVIIHFNDEPKKQKEP